MLDVLNIRKSLIIFKTWRLRWRWPVLEEACVNRRLIIQKMSVLGACDIGLFILSRRIPD